MAMKFNRYSLWRDEGAVARFWKYVERSDGCWLWRGPHNQKGYCTMQVQRDKDRRYVMVHNLSWQIANQRDWPVGMMCCHSCDNPGCVNPAHVRPGTALDNARDMKERGRWRARTVWPAPMTHCKRGHPFEGDNLKHIGKQRRCRECERKYQREWRRAKAKEAAL